MKIWINFNKWYQIIVLFLLEGLLIMQYLIKNEDGSYLKQVIVITIAAILIATFCIAAFSSKGED
jgi:hypothetical protein